MATDAGVRRNRRRIDLEYRIGRCSGLEVFVCENLAFHGAYLRGTEFPSLITDCDLVGPYIDRIATFLEYPRSLPQALGARLGLTDG